MANVSHMIYDNKAFYWLGSSTKVAIPEHTPLRFWLQNNDNVEASFSFVSDLSEYKTSRSLTYPLEGILLNDGKAILIVISKETILEYKDTQGNICQLTNPQSILRMYGFLADDCTILGGVISPLICLIHALCRSARRAVIA